MPTILPEPQRNDQMRDSTRQTLQSMLEGSGVFPLDPNVQNMLIARYGCTYASLNEEEAWDLMRNLAPARGNREHMRQIIVNLSHDAREAAKFKDILGR